MGSAIVEEHLGQIAVYEGDYARARAAFTTMSARSQCARLAIGGSGDPRETGGCSPGHGR